MPFTPEEQERFATDPAALAKARQDLYDMFEGTVAFRLDTHWAEVLKDLARQTTSRSTSPTRTCGPG